MEAKQATLINCVYKNKWTGPKGDIYYFTLTWDNGDIGIMSTNRIKDTGNEILQTKFTIGKHQEYTVEPKVNKKDNSSYLFFDKFKEPYNPNNKQYNNKDEATQNRIAKSVALKAAIRIKAMTGLSNKTLDIANTVFDWIKEYAANDVSRNITAQTAINTTIIYLEGSNQAEQESFKDIAKFLKTCKHFADYIIS